MRRPRTEMTESGTGCDSMTQSELYVAVLDAHDDVVATDEVAPDPVGDGERAVAAAGAADRDRQVALALGDVGGDEELEQRQQAAVELAGLGARLDVLAHRLVEARQRPQLVDVVGIRQEADIEREVGVARRPVLEAEGQQRQRQLAAHRRCPASLRRSGDAACRR